MSKDNKTKQFKIPPINSTVKCDTPFNVIGDEISDVIDSMGLLKADLPDHQKVCMDVIDSFNSVYSDYIVEEGDDVFKCKHGYNKLPANYHDTIRLMCTNRLSRYRMDKEDKMKKLLDETLKASKDIIDRTEPQLESTGTHLSTQSNSNRVNHPEYYNLKDGPYIVHYSQKIPIECIDVIRDMPLWKGNVIKYLWRCGEKHEQGLSDTQKELEDMKKAAWYLNEKIKHMEMDIELETLHDLPEWNGSNFLDNQITTDKITKNNSILR